MGSNEIAIRCSERHGRRNHGVIPWRVALNCGLDDQAILRLCKAGRWERLQPRAYVVAGAPITWQTRLAAVDASLENGFAFSHETAGALLGLDEVEQGSVEIATMQTPKLWNVTIHRVRSPLRRLIRVDGFPITSAHRTVLDLFAVKHRDSAALALEDALRKKLTTIDRLWDEYSSTCTKGRNGCRYFRLALLQRDHRDGTLESRMEAKLRRIVKRLPGAGAVPQFPFQTPQAKYRIDFAYPDIKLGIEAQSIRWHKGEAKGFYDLKRHRHLTRVGWTLLYYSMDDLLNPDEVRTEILDVRTSLQRVLL
jgi:very-short-patch-repair endonuclease